MPERARTTSAMAVALCVLVGCERGETVETRLAGAGSTASTALPQRPTSHKAAAANKAVKGKPCGISPKPGGPLPRPAIKTDPRVSGLKTDAADTEVACSPDEEGLAACMQDYVVFCERGRLYAMDCTLFVDPIDAESATCGELDGAIDCGWED